MFCHSCGKENPNGAKFCRYCGSSIKRPNAAIAKEEVIAVPRECEKRPDVISQEEIGPSYGNKNFSDNPCDASLATHGESSVKISEGLNHTKPWNANSKSSMESTQSSEHKENTDKKSDPYAQSNREADTKNEERDRGKKYDKKFKNFCYAILEQLLDHKMTFFSENPEIPDDAVCISCGNRDTQLIQKSIIHTKTGGYNMESACCGTCLLGPFGLLCGLFGRGVKTHTTNEIWRICNHCGKQHLSQGSALEQVSQIMNGLWINSLLGGCICSCILYWAIPSGWPAILAFLAGSIGIPLLLTGTYYDRISEALGYSIADILGHKERKKYALILLCSIGLFAAAMVSAVPLLEYLA